MHGRCLAALLVLTLAGLVFSSPSSAQFWKQKQPELLAEDQAFVHDTRLEGNELVVDWLIANDYYMYRDQFGVQNTNSGLSFGEPTYPKGVIEEDPEFGEVEVYFTDVSYRLPITAIPEEQKQVSITLLAQGCNKPVGVCYPPQFRAIKLYSLCTADDPDLGWRDRRARKPIAGSCGLAIDLLRRWHDCDLWNRWLDRWRDRHPTASAFSKPLGYRFYLRVVINACSILVWCL